MYLFLASVGRITEGLAQYLAIEILNKISEPGETEIGEKIPDDKSLI